MRNIILASSALALALAGPAIAQGQGGGNGGGKGQQAKADRGGGNPNRGGGQSARAERGPSMKADRGPAMRADRGPAMKADRGPALKADRGNTRAEAKGNGNGNGNAKLRADNRGRDAVNDVRVAGRGFDGNDVLRNGRAGFGCPPGLDRKDNGCLPPGQAMKLNGAPLLAAFSDARIPIQYRSWYPDNEQFYFRSGDGFIYRVNRSNDLVDGLIPLFGNGYYAMGDTWPQPYNFYNVPFQYRSYWPADADYAYRYGDGAIYRLDPRTNAVSAIVALLAGDLGVGSQLPMGYNTYNVPLAYRSQYYDTSDAWYRYNDGYIYRVDPTTRLITAVIDAIV